MSTPTVHLQTDADVAAHELEHHDHTKAYLIVFAVLMVLLFLTVAVYFVPFHEWHIGGYNLGLLGLVIAMVIALIKAICVVLIFMHVKTASRVTWVFAAAGFLWLGIMFTLTLQDYVTRSHFEDHTATPEAVTPAAVQEQPAHRGV